MRLGIIAARAGAFAAITLGVSAVTIASGGIFVAGGYLHRMYRDMFNTYFHQNLEADAFLIHRVLDGDCSGCVLSVGVHAHTGRQGIRWGDDGRVHLLTCANRDDAERLVYEFEGDVQLTLMHGSPAGRSMYQFDSPEICITKEFDDVVVRTFKPISFNSVDLDAMGAFLQYGAERIEREMQLK
jgi:hypothetical protein